MKKSEYKEIKKQIKVEQKDKIKDCKKALKNQKKEYKAYKKGYREAKKSLYNEKEEKLKSLSLEYYGYDFEEEEKVIKEKDLTPEEMKALRDSRRLPFYYRSEEIFNCVSHIVGGGLSIIGLIIGIIFSVLKKQGDVTCLLSIIIFGISSITLYAISAIYHGLYVNKGKKVLQVMDHCTIYFLIAGTYTPVVLLGLQELSPWHYVFLSCIYLCSILGIVLNGTMMEKKIVKVISMILYIAVGWGIIFFYPYLYVSMTLPGVWLLISGGIAYTFGSILYGIGSKRRYFHSIFHIFVVIGSVLQYLSILLYLVI